MPDDIRVRYAPSPTGYPHIGNIRTAFFNWLFARHNGGRFIVRIEDTDQERLVPGAVDAILDGLDWLDIDWDEGPRVGGDFGSYFQSERLPVYRENAERLIAQGDAYRCFCTVARLNQLREEQKRAKAAHLRYDRHCRHLDPAEIRRQETAGTPWVVRFAAPETGVTRLTDLIRDEVEWQNALLDDFILLKSDGFPTYHLAVVTDDHLMQISHVLRAEEWLPSAPRHLLLGAALGYPRPQYGHLPMILGPDRSKLSKRHGATTIMEYRDAGYLPAALRNFMALLGWSLDDKTEVMSLATMQDQFSLDRVGKPAAIFDRDKLDWMNGVYIRELSDDDLAAAMLPWLEKDLPPELLPVDMGYLTRIAPLVRERLKLLTEAAEMTAYFFTPQPDYNPADLIQRGMTAAETAAALDRALETLNAAPDFTGLALEELLRADGEELNLTPRRFFGTLRTAVTGRSVSPPLFDTIAVLGRERVISRLQWAIKNLPNPAAAPQ